MDIQIGNSYKLRNGLTTSPIRCANNGTNYIFEADVLENGYNTPSVLCWLENGQYLTKADNHEKDIVELTN